MQHLLISDERTVRPADQPLWDCKKHLIKKQQMPEISKKPIDKRYRIDILN